ncbi:MAG: hypothetical protein WBP47_26515, partial [Candidatus Promineifilaceae bacterium]
VQPIAAQQFHQSRQRIHRQIAHGHRLRPQLRQPTHVAHVGVGQEDGVRRAQAVGALGVRPQPVGQQVKLVFDVRRGVEEIDGRSPTSRIDNPQTRRVIALRPIGKRRRTARAAAAHMRQPAILHNAQYNGRYAVILSISSHHPILLKL